MGNWVQYKQPQSMGYYKQQEVDFQFALANAFTLCDAYHCAMHTGTNSNRMFIWTGTNGPTGANVASVVNDLDDIGPSTVGYDWTTYPERLQQAGVSGKFIKICLITLPITHWQVLNSIAVPMNCLVNL
jgi:phospholipase C